MGVTIAATGCPLTRSTGSSQDSNVAEMLAALGARQLHSPFEEIGLTQSDFESRTWTRLRQLQYLIQTGQVHENLFWKQPTTRSQSTGSPFGRFCVKIVT